MLIALGAAASLWIGYLVLGNAQLLRHLESQARKAGLSLSVQSSSTWLPGTWSLTNVRLESEGAWSIDAERALLNLDFLDWLRGKTHVTELVLYGATAEVLSARAREARTAGVGVGEAGSDSPVELQAFVVGPSGDGGHMVIDHIAADGDRIRVGEYELSGKLAYRTRGKVVLGRGPARVTGSLDFADAQLRYAGKPSATLSGRASVDLASKHPPDSLRTALHQTDWKLQVEGRLNDSRPLLPSIPVRMTLDAASYRGSFEALGGRMERAHLVLQARRAVVAPGDTSRSELSGNVELLIDFERRRPDQGRAKLKAERWKLFDEAGRHSSKVEGLRATLGWRQNAGAPLRGTLEATGEFEANALRATLAGSFSARFEVTGAISRFELHTGVGEVHVRDAELVPNTAPRTAYGLEANFRVERSNRDRVRGLEYFGDLAVHGKDAGVLLDLGQANDRVRWTLSMLQDQPFSLVSRVARPADALALTDLKLTCAGLEVRGAAYAWNEHKSGAFFVDGPASVGILLRQKSAEDIPELHVVAPIAPRWLNMRLQDLAERWRTRSAAPVR